MEGMHCTSATRCNLCNQCTLKISVERESEAHKGVRGLSKLKVSIRAKATTHMKHCESDDPGLFPLRSTEEAI